MRALAPPDRTSSPDSGSDPLFYSSLGSSWNSSGYHSQSPCGEFNWTRDRGCDRNDSNRTNTPSATHISACSADKTIRTCLPKHGGPSRIRLPPIGDVEYESAMDCDNDEYPVLRSPLTPKPFNMRQSFQVIYIKEQTILPSIPDYIHPDKIPVKDKDNVAKPRFRHWFRNVLTWPCTFATGKACRADSEPLNKRKISVEDRSEQVDDTHWERGSAIHEHRNYAKHSSLTEPRTKYQQNKAPKNNSESLPRIRPLPSVHVKGGRDLQNSQMSDYRRVGAKLSASTCRFAHYYSSDTESSGRLQRCCSDEHTDNPHRPSTEDSVSTKCVMHGHYFCEVCES